MKLRKYAAPIAALSAGALLLAACGGSDDPGTDPTTDTTSAPTDPTEEPGGIADDTIYYTVGSQEWTNYNGQQADSYAVATSVVNNLAGTGFIYFGPDGSIEKNLEYGDYEVLNEEPLSVQYTINDNVTWSDGNPIDYADALLDWASQNPAFLDDDDTPIFKSVSHTLGTYVTEPPVGEIGGREFTYNFETIYADWELLVGGFLPAHVVAEGAGLTEDELAQAILDGDMEKIADIAEFWNTGWANPAPGQLPDQSLIPTSGPYLFHEWVAGQYITLEANPDYWGTLAATRYITFRFVDDAATVSALENGDLDIIEPQATVDTLRALDGLEGVGILTGDTLTWEHLDFNARAGVFQDNLALREAFAYCVPRQEIVDNLIKPINEDAVVMNAREIFPFQEGYDEYVAEIYDGRYDEVDLDTAADKIAESGVSTPVDIVITYAEGNQRRANQVAAIKSSCDQVGFNIIDDAEPGASLGARLAQIEGAHWDISLFAWAGSGQKASGRNIYRTGLPQNWTGYSNEAVDEAWDTLASTVDTDVHREQLPIIEKNLWDDLHGIPIFAHPGVVGYEDSIQNVIFTSTQDQVVWNAEQWVR